MDKIEQLIKERDSIIKQLAKLRERIKSPFCDDELIESIYRKESLLFEIEKSIELYSINPVITNGFIDLYNDPTGNNHFLVCFHEDKNIIGELGFGDSLYADNISYFIKEKYQNMGLGFQSVCLLLKYLNSKGIDHVTVHVEKTNLPSLRIIEKIKDIYPSFSISEYENSIAFHINIDNEKIKSNEITK